MKSHADRQYAASARQQAAAAMKDETPALNDDERSLLFTRALHNVTAYQARRKNTAAGKTTGQMIGEITLAFLRVEGVKNEEMPQSIKDKLHLAAACLDFARTALEQQALQAKVKQAELLEPAA